MAGEGHTLFLACTRPAMWAQIPVEAFVIGAAVIVVGLNVSGHFTPSLWRFPIFLILALVYYIACRRAAGRDPNIFRLVWIWVQTGGRTSRNARFWGGSSLSPVPLQYPTKSSDIPYLAP